MLFVLANTVGIEGQPTTDANVTEKIKMSIRDIQLLPFSQCVAYSVAERLVPSVEPLVGINGVQRPVLLISISLDGPLGTRIRTASSRERA